MKTSFCIDIENIMPGMVLNEDLTADGHLLLPRGAIVKPSYIPQLVARGVCMVNVHAERSLYKEIIKNPVERFYTEAYEDISIIIDSLKTGIIPDSSQLFTLVDNILDKVFTHRNSLLLLTGLRSKCDYYYAHSLDVCIYSLIAAITLNLDCEETVKVGLGALLHDIGKTRIPDEIILKKGSLSKEEFDLVKKHPEYSYRLAESIFGKNHDIAKMILQHHERCDGSGYPYRLKCDEIGFDSQILAAADIYDALTSDKVYRKKILPHEAAEYLLCISNSLINPIITEVFLKNIAIYPKGCQVLLNTNEIAIVLDSNTKMPLRPILEKITDASKNPLTTHFEFDLQAHPGVFIVQLFN